MRVPIVPVNLLALIIIIPSIVRGQTQMPKPYVLKPPREFPLLLDGSFSIREDHDDREAFQKMVTLINKFPDHVKISEQDSRVAIILFSVDARVELGLTGDESQVRGFKIDYPHIKTKTYTELALDLASKDVFAKARPNALKTVIILTDGQSTNRTAAKQSADALRKQDAEIYVVYVGHKAFNKSKIKNHVENELADDASYVFPIADFDKLIEKLLLERVNCSYREFCKLTNETKCQNEWEKVTTLEGMQVCKNPPPTTIEVQCDKSKCDEECDKRWRWEEPCNANNAGQNVTVHRLHPKPESLVAILEHCPPIKTIFCQPPTTTSLEPPGGTKKPGQESEVKDTKDSQSGGNDDKGDGIPDWLIAVIVCVACLLIVAVIAAVVLTQRRKKAKARQAKEKADAEKALAQKKAAKPKSSSDIVLSSGQSSGKTVDEMIGVSMIDKPKPKEAGRVPKKSDVSKSQEKEKPKMKGAESKSTMTPSEISKTQEKSKAASPKSSKPENKSKMSEMSTGKKK